jgi:hypothetical protein
MNVKEIVKEWLIEYGGDGLWNEEIPCGCGRDDLAPCGELKLDCQKGYKSICQTCGHDWYYQKPKIVIKSCDMCEVARRQKGGNDEQR